MSDSRGFTLIEMLVATAVSSIILLMIYTAYSSVIRSINYAKSASAYYEELNFALKRIDGDIANLYWKSDIKNLNFISAEEAGSSILNFVTAEHRDYRLVYNLKEQVPVSDIHEVGYYLKKNPNSDSFDLIRRSDISYDETPIAGGTEEVLLKNVKSLNFEFKYRSDWTPSWDSREVKRIPGVVRTRILLLNPSGNKETYEFLTIPNINSE